MTAACELAYRSRLAGDGSRGSTIIGRRGARVTVHLPGVTPHVLARCRDPGQPGAAWIVAVLRCRHTMRGHPTRGTPCAPCGC